MQLLFCLYSSKNDKMKYSNFCAFMLFSLSIAIRKKSEREKRGNDKTNVFKKLLYLITSKIKANIIIDLLLKIYLIECDAFISH